jgi:hypothetical protein
MRLEGSGGTQLVDVIRSLTKSGDTFELGTVLSPAPEISIRLDNDKLVLDKDSLLVCGSATTVAVNDRVLVIPILDGNTYIIIDKVVSY